MFNLFITNVKRHIARFLIHMEDFKIGLVDDRRVEQNSWGSCSKENVGMVRASVVEDFKTPCMCQFDQRTTT